MAKVRGTTNGRKIKPAPKAKAKARPRPAPVEQPITAPMTPEGLQQQVTAQTALYAGPAMAELQGQRNVNAAQMASIPVWYQDYRNARMLAAQKTQQAYGAALGVQQNVAQSTSALDAQQRANLLASQNDSAAGRGQVVDPRLAAEGQAAATSRRAQLDAQMGLTAGIGAAQTAYRNDQVVTAAGQGIKAMEAEATRGRNLDAAGNKLAADVGNFATTTRQKLIDAEHTKELERKAFGLNAAKAQADAENDAASLAQRSKSDAEKRKLEKGRLQVAQGQLSVAQQRANAYEAKQKAAGKPKMSPAQRNLSISTRDDIEYTLKKIRQLKTSKLPVVDKDGKQVLNPDGSKKTRPAKLTPQQIRTIITTGQGIGKAVPVDIYNAALDIHAKGYLSKANVAALHRRGVAIGATGYKTENGRARKRANSKLKADTGDILAGSSAARP